MGWWDDVWTHLIQVLVIYYSCRVKSLLKLIRLKVDPGSASWSRKHSKKNHCTGSKHWKFFYTGVSSTPNCNNIRCPFF